MLTGMTRHFAVASNSTLGGKVLFAVYFRKLEDLQLVTDYTELEKEKRVKIELQQGRSG